MTTAPYPTPSTYSRNNIHDTSTIKMTVCQVIRHVVSRFPLWVTTNFMTHDLSSSLLRCSTIPPPLFSSVAAQYRVTLHSAFRCTRPNGNSSDMLFYTVSISVFSCASDTQWPLQNFEYWRFNGKLVSARLLEITRIIWAVKG